MERIIKLKTKTILPDEETLSLAVPLHKMAKDDPDHIFRCFEVGITGVKQATPNIVSRCSTQKKSQFAHNHLMMIILQLFLVA